MLEKRSRYRICKKLKLKFFFLSKVFFNVGKYFTLEVNRIFILVNNVEVKNGVTGFRTICHFKAPSFYSAIYLLKFTTKPMAGIKSQILEEFVKSFQTRSGSYCPVLFIFNLKQPLVGEYC